MLSSVSVAAVASVHHPKTSNRLETVVKINRAKEGNRNSLTHQNSEMRVAKDTTAVARPSTGGDAKKSRRTLGWVVARVICLNLPLLGLLLGCAALEWIHHVQDHYLDSLLQDATWTPQRAAQEITYYTRTCSAVDVTTSQPSDLVLPSTATTEVAYQHQLQHGLTVFPAIVSRNHNLTAQESIFLIENDHRYSFALGTEEPSVVTAMKQIANHNRLRPALETILGPSPSLIEMTAITSTFGAVAQHWHDDVIPTASAMNYARSFGPSYSVFIQLQNTTADMGATWVCPGTHYCTDGPIGEFCEEKGFQMVTEHGQWQQGDAILMNMNSRHGGGAHKDPNALDRVMLILTFAPRPRARAESRMISQGITYSMRWDLWGHTLDDMRNVESVMKQPWTILRSLGLYKLPGSQWGFDYISGAVMRMANRDAGFRRDELDTFLERGGFKWLPEFLQGKVNDTESWYEFYSRTFLLCRSFVQYFLMAYAMLYVTLHVMGIGMSHNGSALRSASARLLVFVACAFCCYMVAKWRVDNTIWAADVKAHRYFASTASSFEMQFDELGDWPSTLPTRYDVLLETRYGIRQLHMYNNFIDGHPGNRLYQQLLANAAITYPDYPQVFREASAAYVVDEVLAANGRFLYQAPDGAWLHMDKNSAVQRTLNELLLSSSPLHAAMKEEIRFLLSDLKFGILRDTVMVGHHIAPFLKLLEERLFQASNPAPVTPKRVISHASSTLLPQPWTIHRAFHLPKCRTNAQAAPRQLNVLPPRQVHTEPFVGAWLSEGDIAETLYENYWYKGKVTHVSAHGEFSMSYADGSSNFAKGHFIRRFEPYRRWEEVEVFYKGTYAFCEIVFVPGDGTYHALIVATGAYLTGITEDSFRRLPGILPQQNVYRPAY